MKTNTEVEQLKSALASIRKQKQVNGVFNLEGLKTILSALEHIDISFERKARATTITCVISFIAAIVLLFAAQPMLLIIAASAGVILLLLTIYFRRFDLDNEFRLFVNPLLRLLEEDIKPGSDLRVKLELNAPYNKKFFKGKSAKYSSGPYSCHDHLYERETAVLQMRFFDGNRLMVTINEHSTRTVKTKTNYSGKTKIKTRFKKLITLHLRLRVNPARFRCNSPAPEMEKPHQSRVSDTTLDHEQIQCLDTGKGLLLDMTFRVKVKGITPNDKRMALNPEIVPVQILKLYSLLEPTGQDTIK